ncbi:MAG: 50S ribosomal protein L22 [Armatimonadetes bacterium]|nr:50S ribosomal protein L22 [Armatimonadota bacterium]
MEKERLKIKNQKEKLSINKKEGEKKEAKAIARFIHMTPRKLRLVLNVIRGKDAFKALSILKFIPKRASRPLEKILKSAIANAENNLKLNSDKLFISQAYVDQGPTMKRFMPRAMGRASLIHKRTSHITIVVSEKI